jgi:hypothetical protein
METPDDIASKLTTVATSDGWKIEPEQATEWRESISLLRIQAFDDPIGILREALQTEQLECIDSVVLEYDFRRRGLRIDAILLLGSHALVVEFKRSKLSAGDRDQVVNYCVNLCEFHEVTQNNINSNSGMVIPILVSREDTKQELVQTDLSNCFQDWKAIPRQTVRCHGSDLREALIGVTKQLIQTPSVTVETWNHSPFKPSSTIIDAALSLYGNHDVSAIKEHANEMETIEKCTNEIKAEIQASRNNQGKSLIFMSGAPGAGKTLVGLDIAFSDEFRENTVFLTGNAPLVDVLQGSLKRSYRSMSDRRISQLTGYSKESVKFVKANTVFKIVKAHHFLKKVEDKNDYQIASTDGDVLIIDEAQRTYTKGRIVIDHPLPDHEANMIVKQMEIRDRPVIVLLLGHNQNINRGERGAIAWLEAAEKYGWNVSISEDTLNLSEFEDETRRLWKNHPLRKNLVYGHLQDSIRYYRNKSVEKWAHYVLTDDPVNANNEADELNIKGHNIWITRSLDLAKKWAKEQRLGEERAGLIASGKGIRLAAEGIFPGLKPNIAHWMLSPMGDIRSSNMLETAQNQFQIQGLELDHTIVCWDADLRIENSKWSCYNISGGGWQKSRQESALIERKNGYRVLLTRARKGMILFVPKGDLSMPIEDETRNPDYYDGIYDYLLECGSISIDK